VRLRPTGAGLVLAVMAPEERALRISQRGKSFAVCPGRATVFWDLVSRGAWEPETFTIFDRFLDRDHSYIDIGSWIGPTLLYACQIARRAYGIEPDPVAFEELKQNIALNTPIVDNVRLFNGCVAPKSGQVHFGSRSEAGDSTSSLLFAKGKTKWTVEGLCFEEFIRQNEISDCNFIKMDIEGGEYRVLPTMKRYLKANRPTLHVSLHPLFLGDLDNNRLWHKIARLMSRLLGTLRIIQSVRFYRHLYDHHGRAITFLRLLWVCRKSVCLDVVLTDHEWYV
jgi:FkbM family methyltransferase